MSKMLIPAGEIEPGCKFVKKGGENIFTVIRPKSLSGGGFRADPHTVYGVDKEGYLTTRRKDQLVHPAGQSGVIWTTIADAQDRLRKAEQRVQEADQAKRLALEDLTKQVARMVGVPHENLSGMEGGWDCEGPSPTGQCLYNIAEDPCEDFCLFCGAPSERK